MEKENFRSKKIEIKIPENPDFSQAVERSTLEPKNKKEIRREKQEKKQEAKRIKKLEQEIQEMPEKVSETELEAPESEEAPEKPEKKGFFSRLFSGKEEELDISETEEEKQGEEKKQDESKNNLETAREKFVKIEKEYEKYQGLRGVFKGKKEKANIEDEHEEAKEKYQEARAEYVADDMERFLDERIDIADTKAEDLQAENKLSYKLYKGWKKLGDWNLDLAYQKIKGKEIKGKWRKRAARMLSARTGISFGLLGIGVGLGAGTAVGAGAFALKRGFAGLGTGMGVGMGGYSLAKWAQRKNIEKKLTDEKIENLEINELEENMAKLEVTSALRGEKISNEKNQYNEIYKSLQEKYKEKISADSALDELIAESDEKLKNIAKKTKRNEKIVKGFSSTLGVGVGVAVGGLGKIKELLGGGENIAPETSLAEKLGLETEQELPEIEKSIPESRPVVSKPIEDLDIEKPKTDVNEMEIKDVEAMAKIPDVFEETVNKGEGYIHQARKAIDQYIDKKDIDLTKAQRIKAEADLFKVLQTESGGELEILHSGDTVEFSRDNIEQAIQDVQEKFNPDTELGQQLEKNIEEYIEKVNWEDVETDSSQEVIPGHDQAEEVLTRPEISTPEQESKILLEQAQENINKTKDALDQTKKMFKPEEVEIKSGAEETVQQPELDVIDKTPQEMAQESGEVFHEKIEKAEQALNGITDKKKHLEQQHKNWTDKEWQKMQKIIDSSRHTRENIQALGIEEIAEQTEINNLTSAEKTSQSLENWFENKTSFSGNRTHQVNELLKSITIDDKPITWEQAKEWLNSPDQHKADIQLLKGFIKEFKQNPDPKKKYIFSQFKRLMDLKLSK